MPKEMKTSQLVQLSPSLLLFLVYYILTSQLAVLLLLQCLIILYFPLFCVPTSLYSVQCIVFQYCSTRPTKQLLLQRCYTLYTSLLSVTEMLYFIYTTSLSSKVLCVVGFMILDFRQLYIVVQWQQHYQSRPNRFRVGFLQRR